MLLFLEISSVYRSILDPHSIARHFVHFHGQEELLLVSRGISFTWHGTTATLVVQLFQWRALQSETSVPSEHNDLFPLPLTHHDRVHLTSVLVMVEVVRRGELDCITSCHYRVVVVEEGRRAERTCLAPVNLLRSFFFLHYFLADHHGFDLMVF